MTEKEKILSNDYMDIITDAAGLWEINSAAEDYFYQQVAGDFGIFYVNRSTIPPLSVAYYTYRAIPKLLVLEQTGDILENSRVFDPTALEQSGILQVQRPPLSLTGSGVIIGFIDTGIRYTEEVFRYPDGTSRVLAIWDQTIQTGKPPGGLEYGTEYTKAMIDQALRTENPRQYVPSWDENGHGSAMASVAAGSTLGDGTVFQGAAPDCQIIVVKCKEAKPYLKDFYFVPQNETAYEETDIILAFKYIEEFAIAYSRPVIICFGMGTSMGGHASGSPFSAFINETAVRRSRIVVTGGGNQGNARHHFSGSVKGPSNRNEFADIEIQVGEGVSGFNGELWGTLPDALAVTVRSPGGETTQKLDFRTKSGRDFAFIYEETTIRIDYALVEESTGDELFIFRFIRPTPGIWTIRVSSGFERISNRGEFNMWIPITTGDKVVFLSPDPYITLTGPANTLELVSVTTYNQENGGFYGVSGRGFNRIGEIRPDVSAPGVNIDTIIGKVSGSSMASAITAGAAAQFMEWAVVEGNHVHVQSKEFKNYLILGATRAPELTYPNREWGYGKLNIAGAFEMLAGLS